MVVQGQGEHRYDFPRRLNNAFLWRPKAPTLLIQQNLPLKAGEGGKGSVARVWMTHPQDLELMKNQRWIQKENSAGKHQTAEMSDFLIVIFCIFQKFLIIALFL